MKFPKDLGFNHCAVCLCTKLPNRIYYITLIVQDDCCTKRYCLIRFCSDRISALLLVHGCHAFKVYISYGCVYFTHLKIKPCGDDLSTCGKTNNVLSILLFSQCCKWWLWQVFSSVCRNAVDLFWMLQDYKGLKKGCTFTNYNQSNSICMHLLDVVVCVNRDSASCFSLSGQKRCRGHLLRRCKKIVKFRLCLNLSGA